MSRLTQRSSHPRRCRASRSATRAWRAASSVSPVAVIASRFAYHQRGRRSMAATCQSATSPWYVHGPTAQPGIRARASWTDPRRAHVRRRPPRRKPTARGAPQELGRAPGGRAPITMTEAEPPVVFGVNASSQLDAVRAEWLWATSVSTPILAAQGGGVDVRPVFRARLDRIEPLARPSHLQCRAPPRDPGNRGGGDVEAYVQRSCRCVRPC